MTDEAATPQDAAPDTAAAPDAAAAPETVVTAPDTEAPATDADGSPWFSGAPDDWREQIAGEDQAKLNQLKRITEPGQLFNNYFEAQETLRSRNEAQGLPAEPTDEQLAAYREEKGIPATPDGYELKLSEGLVLSDEEKGNLAPVFDIMHEANIDSGTASKLVDTYMQIEEQAQERRLQQDNVDSTEATKMMEKHWGGDFEQNKNIMIGMLQKHLPAETLEGFMGARLADGKAIFNDPGVMSALANIARELNPAATLVPSGANPIKSLEGKIQELEARMGDDTWHKDTAAQEEYQAAIDARDTLLARQQ